MPYPRPSSSPSPDRFPARPTEPVERFAWPVLLAEAVTVAMVAWLEIGFWPEARLGAAAFAGLGAGLVLLHAVLWLRRLAPPLSTLEIVGHVTAMNFLLWVLAPALGRRMGAPPDAVAFSVVLLICTPLQALLHWAHAGRRRWDRFEPLRWALLAAAAGLLGFPFVTPHSVGTGDAYWYANMIGDFNAQWQAGIFPVFVGQSDYAFNGAVSPLRYAPYLQHLAGLLDLLTARTLSPVALLNLAVFGSLAAAGFTCYFSLAAIAPRRRWLAGGFALLFLASPAVLSLLYTGNLFMSVCTLPYLPLVALGIWRTFQRNDLASVCFLAAALAAAWLCHPPIAFWAAVIAAASQLIRLARTRAVVRTCWQGTAAAALFAVLTGFAFVSALTLALPAPAAAPTTIVESLRKAFPASLLPVSAGAATLSDYQLGWSLWLALGAGVAGAIILRSRGFLASLLAGSALLLLLLLPTPFLLAGIWRHMPAPVADLTYMWPMQRFYVLLAILAVFLGYVGLIELSRSGRSSLWLAAPVGLALLWSADQARLFLKRGIVTTTSAAAAHFTEARQNRILTRYAFSPFPAVPPYFSHGYVDPLLENRLLAPGSFAEIVSNHGALRAGAGVVRAEGPLAAKPYPASDTFFELSGAKLALQPRRHYDLEVGLAASDLQGSVIGIGSSLQRDYYLPDSGTGLAVIQPLTSFGTLPASGHDIPLWSDAPGGETLLLQFVSNVPLKGDLSAFGRYVLREFTPAQLPVAVEELTPYRALVRAPAESWLETPRLFIPGYAAAVNGRPVSVSRSPGGLVMLPVPAGPARVELRYPGPALLRASYYLTLAAWLGLGGAALLRAFRGRGSKPQALFDDESRTLAAGIKRPPEVFPEHAEHHKLNA